MWSEKIRKIFNIFNLNQSQFARIVGINQSTVSLLLREKRGKRLSSSIATKIELFERLADIVLFCRLAKEGCNLLSSSFDYICVPISVLPAFVSNRIGFLVKDKYLLEYYVNRHVFPVYWLGLVFEDFEVEIQKELNQEKEVKLEELVEKYKGISRLSRKFAWFADASHEKFKNGFDCSYYETIESPENCCMLYVTTSGEKYTLDYFDDQTSFKLEGEWKELILLYVALQIVETQKTPPKTTEIKIIKNKNILCHRQKEYRLKYKGVGLYVSPVCIEALKTLIFLLAEEKGFYFPLNFFNPPLSTLKQLKQNQKESLHDLSHHT